MAKPGLIKLNRYRSECTHASLYIYAAIVLGIGVRQNNRQVWMPTQCPCEVLISPTAQIKGPLVWNGNRPRPANPVNIGS